MEHLSCKIFLGVVLFSLLSSINLAQYALKLDNDNGYVAFGEPADLDVSNITIEAWIRLSDYRPGTVFAKPGAYFLRVDDNLQLNAAIYNESDQNWFEVSGSTILDINEWYHVAFSYDGNNLLIFLNGALDGSQAYSGQISPLLTNPVYAGNQIFIDDFSDYSSAFEDTKIYYHENYGTANQQIDVTNDRYHFNGQNTINNVNDEAISYIKGFFAQDYIVQVDERWAQQEGNAYITMRFKDVRDKYEIAVDPEWNAFYFNKVVNDHWTAISSTGINAINNDTWYTIKTQLTTLPSQNNVKAWVDGTKYIDANDNELYYDNLGIIVHDHDYQNFSYDIYFDNWQVFIPFKGNIDEIRIFDLALSPANIMNWMCRTVDNSHDNWSHLNGYWRFDDQSDPTDDYSANNNKGNLNSASFVTSKVPTGYANHVSSGNSNISETSAVEVDVTWSGNTPGSTSLTHILQIEDRPQTTANLLNYFPARYWELNTYNDDGFYRADISFHFDHIAGIHDESTLRVYWRSQTASAWSAVSNFSLDDEGSNIDGIGSISVTDITNFGQFIICSNSGDNSLPVELSSFTVSTSAGEVNLLWRTECEINNLGFEIQRLDCSLGEAQEFWDRVGFIQGAGNTSQPTNYSFTDRPGAGYGHFKYRLKQLDLDGQFFFSNILDVVIQPPSTFELKQNYPNPFNNSTQIEYVLSQRCQVNLRVLNVLGENIVDLIDSVKQAGNYQYNFVANNLPAGIYFYELTVIPQKDGVKSTKIRKMILLK